MTNYQRLTRTTLLGLGLLLTGSVSAQVFPLDGEINTDVSIKKYASQGVNEGSLKEIDGLLKAAAGEYMSGIADYAVEIGDLLIGIAKDKIVEGAAELAGDIRATGRGNGIASKISESLPEK